MCAGFTVDPRIDHQRSEILLKPLSSLNLIHSKQHHLCSEMQNRLPEEALFLSEGMLGKYISKG